MSNTPREDVIKLAREAGFAVGIGSPALPKFTHLVQLVKAEEREACAKVCESNPERIVGGSVYTADQMRDYGEQCWKAGYKHGAWGDKPAVNQQLTTEPVDEREARATLPTQRSSMDGLPKPFGYVSDGFADGLRFQHNPWPVEHTLLHSTMPVFSAAAVQQFKQDAERYRWLASSESVAMNAKTKDHQWAISDAWTTLEKLDADKALIDAAIDAAMAQGVK